MGAGRTVYGVHFGMLRPQKGLEEFIELSELSKAAGHPWRFKIIGAIVPHAQDYAERLFRLAEGAGIELGTNLGPKRYLTRCGMPMPHTSPRQAVSTNAEELCWHALQTGFLFWQNGLGDAGVSARLREARRNTGRCAISVRGIEQQS